MRWIAITAVAALVASCVARNPNSTLKDAEPSPQRPADPCDPGHVLDDALEVANGGGPISGMVPRLFAEGVTLDAVRSPSAQSSRSNADPRLLIKSGCAIFTFTLLGKSLEMGIQEQKATQPLPTGGHKPNDVGEILVDMKDASLGRFVASEITSHWDPRMRRNDSNQCTGCHIDIQTTQFGLKPVVSTGGEFLALVNPLAAGGENTAGYCIPGDLVLIRDCACGQRDRPTGCERLERPFPDDEGCARLDALLALSPRPFNLFPPGKNEKGELECL